MNGSEKYQVMPDLAAEEYEALKADIAAHGVLVPVELDEEGAVLDGHHRVRACQELGITDYPTIVRPGLSEEEKKTHARRLNLARRHLTQEQKRELIRQHLQETPETSDRQIAALLGVSHPTVGEVRREMEMAGQLEKFTSSVGADGKERPRYTAKDLQKIHAVCTAATEEPEKYAPLLQKLRQTGRINSTYEAVRQEQQREALSRPPKELAPPSTGGRKVSAVRWVYKETGAVKYELRIGPNAVGRRIAELYAAKEQSPEYRQQLGAVKSLRQEVKRLRQQAQRLEEQARTLEQAAKADIQYELEDENGPIEPFVETFDCEVLDRELNAQLARLGKAEADQIGSLLLAARGTDKIEIKDCGVWGDIRFMSFARLPESLSSGWTRIGGMDGLREEAHPSLARSATHTGCARSRMRDRKQEVNQCVAGIITEA